MYYTLLIYIMYFDFLVYVITVSIQTPQRKTSTMNDFLNFG